MVHLVYCNDKEKVIEKILDGTKTMVIRALQEGKFLTAEFGKAKRCTL